MSKDKILEQYFDSFCKEFAPDDRYRSAEFSSRLMMIVRLTYQAAQEPYVREYRSLMDATLTVKSLTATDVCKIKGDY